MSNHIIVKGKPRHIHGWKPDKPDHRDMGYAYSLKCAHLPVSVDLRDSGHLPRVEDQGNLGSCTMNASTSAMEYLYKLAGKTQPELSRLFGYYTERVRIENTSATEDSGAQIRDAIKSLVTYGTCLETTWPYDVTKFSENPPQPAWDEALQHRVNEYFKVVGLVGLRSCLAEGYPVVIGFSVPENMESEEAASTGVITYPSQNESIVGGHAVLIIGYDDSKQMLIFQNSWSTDWGDKGFGYLPYQFVSMGLASDFWTVRTEDF